MTSAAPGDQQTLGKILFYRQLEPLSMEKHKSLGVSQVQNPFSFLAETHLVPLTVDEFGLAAICYPHTSLPEHRVMERVARLGAAERLALIRAYVGERENRRHKPGRAFERVDYRFDVLSDYGAFRDLQRHRLLTIEWQRLTPRHGYVRPELVDDAGQAGVPAELGPSGPSRLRRDVARQEQQPRGDNRECRSAFSVLRSTF